MGLAVYSYIDQLLLLRKYQSIGSFSVFITAIVIVSNTLKFFYWFTEPYKINLFIQCLLLISVNVLSVLPSCLLSESACQSGIPTITNLPTPVPPPTSGTGTASPLTVVRSPSSKLHPLAGPGHRPDY